jgi:hypothetical protein
VDKIMALIKKYIHLLAQVQNGIVAGWTFSGFECYFMDEGGVL